mmetsp:Transcript_35581/g.101758  ORF Transcript_35581/g.101758 Transcript_35581/m.101758 type:complete len:262 (-) Transcript_35581:721-1506(-)
MQRRCGCAEASDERRQQVHGGLRRGRRRVRRGRRAGRARVERGQETAPVHQHPQRDEHHVQLRGEGQHPGQFRGDEGQHPWQRRGGRAGLRPRGGAGAAAGSRRTAPRADRSRLLLEPHGQGRRLPGGPEPMAPGRPRRRARRRRAGAHRAESKVGPARPVQEPQRQGGFRGAPRERHLAPGRRFIHKCLQLRNGGLGDLRVRPRGLGPARRQDPDEIYQDRLRRRAGEQRRRLLSPQDRCLQRLLRQCSSRLWYWQGEEA